MGKGKVPKKSLYFLQFDPVEPLTRLIVSNPLTSRVTFSQVRGSFAGKRWRSVRGRGRHANI